METTRFVLDTYALLALLEDEPGAQVVADIISNDNNMSFLSYINLGEAYYIIRRKKGDREAEEFANTVFAEASITLIDCPWKRIQEAARVKTGGGLSYADSFVVSLAQELEAPIVTGDPEIQRSATKLGLKIIWIGDEL
ncbi:type II toxin-antitoxin system VapC family toxin [Moorella sp. Hama-1]|uniref:type II toxin-antitoxin system VapC family toxin n=1 Tax=Moorella sp. Hama-1 TaxID=2138101 RepID=UPI000D645C63|nr:type II toxin-antitoxin system VapC family toxin [Moorella sp. Hama-1]BCV22913.1 twitching motility protein PilT [Moorella sp. Hama-1]